MTAIDRIIASSKNRLLFSFLLLLVLLVCFYPFTNFSDTAYLGGDTWEYQSIGVNYAKGYGFPRIGGFASYNTYKFDRTDIPLFKAHALTRGYNFYRTPIYPLFLGITYKIFGVYPLVAKLLQFLLILIVSAAMPCLGFYYWQKIGFVAGIAGSFVHSIFHFKVAGFLMTESLIIFWVFVICLGHIYYERRTTIWASVVFGVILGLALLLKGSLVYIPFFWGLYKLYRWVKTRKLVIFRNLCIVSLSAVLVILPWSIYATQKSGQRVLLSTQGSSLFLEANNEQVSETGLWESGYLNKSTNYYKTDGMEGKNELLRVANFYLHSPLSLVKSFFYKLFAAFYNNPFFFFVTIVLICKALFFTQPFKLINKPLYKKSIISLFVLFVSLVTLITNLLVYVKTENVIYVLFKNVLFTPFLRAISPFRGFLEFLYTYRLILFLSISITLIYSIVKLEKKRIIELPRIFSIIFLNFFAIILLTTGELRYTIVVDFLLILYGLVAVIKYLFTNDFRHKKTNLL